MASLWGGASSPAARDKEMDEEEHLSGKARCSKLDDVVAALLGDGDSSNNDGNNDDADDDLLYQPVVFRSSSQRSHDQTAPPTVTQEQDYHPSVGECPGSSSQQEQQLGSCLSSSDSVKEKGQRLSLSESLVADKPLSAEALERAEKRAREYVEKDTTELSKCNKLSEVFWCFDKDKRYPVVLAPPAMLPRSSPRCKKGGKDGKMVGVFFLGMAYSHSWTDGLYSRTALKPFDFVVESSRSGRSSSRTRWPLAGKRPPNKSDDARSDDARHDAYNYNLPGETEVRWNPALMDQYIKALAKHKNFRDPKTGVVDREKLEVERAYLKHALLRIRDNQASKEEQEKKKWQLELRELEKPELDDDGEWEDGDGDDSNYEPASQQPSALCPSPSVTNRQRNISCAAGAVVVRMPCGSQPARPKIRAGDHVRYIPPILVAATSNERVARVVKVNSKNDDVVLELSTGDLLGADDQVCVTHRVIRNGLVKIQPRFRPVREHFLDQTRNGKAALKNAHPNRVAESFARTQAEMDAIFREVVTANPKTVVDLPSRADTGESDVDAEPKEAVAATLTAPSSSRRQNGPPSLETKPNVRGNSAKKKRSPNEASSLCDGGPVAKRRRSGRRSQSQ